MLAIRAFQAFMGVFWGTPIGRKSIMATSGAGSVAFLVFHLGGNLIFFQGRPAYERYGAILLAVPFLPVIEVLLGLMLLTHMGLGITLFIQNLRARPVGYSRLVTAGGRTPASKTMLYSGLTIFAFLLLHLWNMDFGPDAGVPLYDRVAKLLGHGVPATLYGLGLAAVGLHLSHGSTSALLTLGLRHELHDPWVDLLGRIFATALAMGFGAIVVYCVLEAGGA